MMNIVIPSALSHHRYLPIDLRPRESYSADQAGGTEYGAMAVICRCNSLNELRRPAATLKHRKSQPVQLHRAEPETISLLLLANA